MNKAEPIRNQADIEAMKNVLTGRNRLMFVMGVSMGLRISDLLSLKIGDLRDKSHLVIVEKKTENTRKQRKPRRIKISETVKREIEQLDGPDNEYIFKSRQGGNKPISRIQAYRILNKAAEQVGLVERDENDKIIRGAISCHSLRKTFGYQLYERQGLDITRVMTILQHSSPEVTLAYIGITDEEIDAAYEAIEI